MRGSVPRLRRLHEELDDAVLRAYHWPAKLADEQILGRMVALNAERVGEEARGHMRWLRPEWQKAG